MFLNSSTNKILLIPIILISFFIIPISCKKDKIPSPENQIPDGATAIPAYNQRTGNVTEGYNYLVAGDYIKSGIPINIFTSFYLLL